MQLLKQQRATIKNTGLMYGWSDDQLCGRRDFTGSWALLEYGYTCTQKRNKQPKHRRNNQKVPKTAWGNQRHAWVQCDDEKMKTFKNYLFCFFSGLNINHQNNKRYLPADLVNKSQQPEKKKQQSLTKKSSLSFIPSHVERNRKNTEMPFTIIGRIVNYKFWQFIPYVKFL